MFDRDLRRNQSIRLEARNGLQFPAKVRGRVHVDGILRRCGFELTPSSQKNNRWIVADSTRQHSKTGQDSVTRPPALVSLRRGPNLSRLLAEPNASQSSSTRPTALLLGELRQPKHSLTDKTENPANPDAWAGCPYASVSHPNDLILNSSLRTISFHKICTYRHSPEFPPKTLVSLFNTLAIFTPEDL